MMAFLFLPSGVTLVGRYQVLRPLGRGGMGTVYLARDLRFARRLVALKENADRADKCIDRAGLPEYDGCPADDPDGDGVIG